MKTYYDVYFTQGETGSEMIEEFDTMGVAAFIDYLLGAGLHWQGIDSPYGLTDKIFVTGEFPGYVVSVNRKYGTIGLTYEKDGK